MAILTGTRFMIVLAIASSKYTKCIRKYARWPQYPSRTIRSLQSPTRSSPQPGNQLRILEPSTLHLTLHWSLQYRKPGSHLKEKMIFRRVRFRLYYAEERIKHTMPIVILAHSGQRNLWLIKCEHSVVSALLYLLAVGMTANTPSVLVTPFMPRAPHPREDV